MARRGKKSSIPAWDLVCNLLERAVQEASLPTTVLAPLGDFQRHAVDDAWAKVVDAAPGRMAKQDVGDPRQHIGEVIGDVLQAEDDIARVNLAFCQTPYHVAEYLIDHVLVAYDKFGLFNTGAPHGPQRRRRRIAPEQVGRRHEADQRLRLLDPSCGSGHLLIRAVRRIARILPLLPGDLLWNNGIDPLVWACGSVAGFEINPQAAAVARVRLAMELASSPGRDSDLGKKTMKRVIEGDIVRVGDSLLEPGEARFEMLVANPPYVTPRDRDNRDAIRMLYESAHGQYGLHGPFLEAIVRQWLMPGGFAMAIVGNGFMKREWGASLIEKVLSQADLRLIVDTSGAFIPGHGTPTVILGLRGYPCADVPVQTVKNMRGEPGVPKDLESGLNWSGIRAHTMLTLAAMVREPWEEAKLQALRDEAAMAAAQGEQDRVDDRQRMKAAMERLGAATTDTQQKPKIAGQLALFGEP